MPLFLMIVAALIWVCIGWVLGPPYNWLAGGGSDNQWLTVLLAPLGSLGLVITLFVSDHYRQMRWFWLALIWWTLPIIFNGASILMRVAGYERVASLFFDWRYGVMWTPLILAIGFAIIALAVEGLHDWWRRRQGRAGAQK